MAFAVGCDYENVRKDLLEQLNFYLEFFRGTVRALTLTCLPERCNRGCLRRARVRGVGARVRGVGARGRVQVRAHGRARPVVPSSQSEP